MQEEDYPLSKRLQPWYRALGRLHRRTLPGMRHLRQEDDIDRSSGPRSLTPPQPEARDVGPTDPEVYAGPSRPPRPPTPRPRLTRLEEIYDEPRTSVPSTITPTSDLLREILSEIGENPGVDVVGDVRPPPGNTPPPSYNDLRESPESPASSPCSLVEGGYISMASNVATTRSSPRNVPPTSVRVPQRDLESAYEGLSDPLQYNHALGERIIPIPQGSPPLRPPLTVPTPVYYRDYSNPNAFPAYARTQYGDIYTSYHAHSNTPTCIAAGATNC